MMENYLFYRACTTGTASIFCVRQIPFLYFDILSAYFNKNFDALALGATTERVVRRPWRQRVTLFSRKLLIAKCYTFCKIKHHLYHFAHSNDPF